MPKIKLTRLFIGRAKCPANKSKISFSDTKIKGLILEVRTSGGKTFYIRYRDEYGSQRHIKIGNAEIIELSSARRKSKLLLAEISLGSDPLKEIRSSRKVITLEKFAYEQYIPHAQSYKRSWKSDFSYLKIHILPALGHKRLNAITRQDVSFLHTGMKRKGYADGTSNRILILLRYMFNLALRWQLEGVKANPTKNVMLFKLNNKRQIFLSKRQVHDLIVEVKKSQNKELHHIVRFLLLTGARKGEVLNSKWENIDSINRIWTILLSKSGRDRVVPLSDGAMMLINSLPSKNNSIFLFPNPKTDKPYVAIFNSWDYARKKAGIPNVRIHDLRHSFASFLVNSGRSLYEVQKLLGHTQISTTERYAHLSAETLIDAANTAADYIPSL